MKSHPLPFQKLIFVCTNRRAPGERISCSGEGRCGEKIFNQLKSHVKEKNLTHLVRISKSGCLDRCEEGPSLVVLPDNEFLTDVQVDDIKTIIDTHLIEKNLT